MKLTVIFFLILSISSVFSQVLNIPKQDTTKKVNAIAELQRDLDFILKNKELNDCFYGISIVSAETGEVLYKKNEAKNFIPASNQKLFTTATALRYLGADYKFLTRMYIDGQITEDGTLYGNIIIRGYGDPTHSSFFRESPDSVFKYFSSVLDSLGIKSIDGDIIGDDNFFDDVYYCDGWQVDDLINSYAAQVNALSAYDNKITITLSSGIFVGDNCPAIIEPDIGYIQLNNFCKTSNESSGPTIKVNRGEGTNIITISGHIPFDSLQNELVKIPVTIDNPTLWFLSNFKQFLTDNSISHYGALLDVDDLGALIDYSVFSEFFSFYSPKLSEIIGVINKNSHNLAAEMLLKTTARETTGFGSTTNGIQQIYKFLNRSGIEPENIKMVDGSGLSRLNLFSPISITNLLVSMYKSNYNKLYLNSLAEPGEVGTLNKRMTKTLAQNRIHAKTGSLNYVSTLSGYTFTRDEEPIAFSLMFLNFNSNQNAIQTIQDLICLRLTAFSKNQIKE